MKVSASLFICLISIIPAMTYGQEPPAIDGYVTRAASPNDFDANGFHVICSVHTRSITRQTPGPELRNQGCPAVLLWVGEPIKIYGSRNNKARTIKASLIDAAPLSDDSVKGSSVIEALVSGNAQSGELLLRADGYRIRITSKTRISLNSPLQAIADIKAGDWLDYKGKQEVSGEVVAESAQFARDVVKKGEEKLRAKYEYDEAAVKDSDKQNSVVASILGIDPKKFPPYINPAMQARIDEIGNRLVPAYQRNLSDSDPTKIQFRFQLIDTKWFRDTMPLPSGLILVPHQVVERMQNDSQLAAVLADGIAAVLEKEQYRMQPASRLAAAAAYGGMFVPYAGPALQVGGLVIAHQTIAEAQHQCFRVSLGLMHDAGFDIDQAPKAWWLLNPKKPRPIEKIAISGAASYVYRAIGESWRPPSVHDSPEP